MTQTLENRGPQNTVTCEPSSFGTFNRGGFASFPLSPGQERLWFIEQIHPHTSLHNIPQAWRLRGKLDADALAAAVAELGQRHETLRTAIVAVDGQPMQAVYATGLLHLERAGLPGEASLAAALAREAAKPFELARAPLARFVLFRLADEDHVLLLNLHHIVSDEWSVGVLARELVSLYTSKALRKDSRLPALSLQFADYAAWQRQRLTSGQLQPQLDYWKEQLKGELPFVALPADNPRPAVASGCGMTIFAEIPGDVLTAAASFSRSQTATLFMVLVAAFKAVLFRYTRLDETLVGTTFSGRDRLETEALVGFFVNTQVLRVRVGDDPTFLELLDRVKEAALGASANQEAALDTIVDALHLKREAGSQPLFQLMVGLQTGAMDNLPLPGIQAEPIELENGTSKFDLSLLMTQAPRGLKLRCEFNRDLFERATVERFLRNYETLLRGAIEHADLRLSQLPMLSDAERKQLLFVWSQTPLECPGEKRLHELFETQAAARPSQIAVVCGAESLTYGQLNERAERLAVHLRGRGVTADVPVGVCIRRKPSLIVALLAILKSGAAYLPLDPCYPGSRLRFMISDANVRFILTERELQGELPGLGAESLSIERLECETDPPGRAGSPLPTDWQKCARFAETSGSRSLAYVIYTSGSTGQPKGVALEHHGAVALMYWARQQYTPEELRGVLAATSVCFDLSVFEIFAPLSWGGTVILAENALSLSVMPGDCGVTLINTVPSAVRELLALKCIPDSVRVVNLAGEPLPRELADRIYAETGVEKVYDLYGPTETTTYSTGSLRTRGGPETIGRPLPGERVYVLDPDLNPAPIGVPGELYIGGEGVARGYINRPELTAQRFLSDPFVPGARMYKTGDQARWRADGTLQYLGRIDHQVKIRGFRIELEEVRAAVKRHPGVLDALVVAREEGNAGKVLVAYVVPKPGCAPAVEALRETASQVVPEFMVPTYFIWLSEFPLTPNGKVDRAALPAPVPAPKSEASLAPRTLNEQALAGIWAEVLGHTHFGVTDDFFQVGGHSLLATRVASRISARFGLELPVVRIFEQPTIAKLAATLNEIKAVPASETRVIKRRMRPSTAEELLAALDTLSEAEVEELLHNPELKLLVK